MSIIERASNLPELVKYTRLSEFSELYVLVEINTLILWVRSDNFYFLPSYPKNNCKTALQMNENSRSTF